MLRFGGAGLSRHKGLQAHRLSAISRIHAILAPQGNNVGEVSEELGGATNAEDVIFAALEQAVAGASCLIVQGGVIADDSGVGDDLNVVVVGVREHVQGKVHICKAAWQQFKAVLDCMLTALQRLISHIRHTLCNAQPTAVLPTRSTCEQQGLAGHQ